MRPRLSVLLSSDRNDLLAELGENPARWLRFLKRRAPDGADVDDLLQDAMVRALRTQAPPEPAKRSAWFHQILRNVVADATRTKMRAPHQLDTDAPLPEALHADLDGARAGDVPWSCECDDKLYAGLSPEQGELVRRVYLLDEAVGPVAAELGISLSSAYVSLHRARHRLRRDIERMCGSTDYASARACGCDAAGCAD